MIQYWTQNRNRIRTHRHCDRCANSNNLKATLPSKEQASFFVVRLLRPFAMIEQFSVSAHSPPQEINISGALSRQMCGVFLRGLDSDGWDGREPLETWEQSDGWRRPITCSFVPVHKTVFQLVLAQNFMDLLERTQKREKKLAN